MRTVQNVIPIQAAKTVTVVVHGNAIVNQDGVVYCVMNVNIFFCSLNFVFNGCSFLYISVQPELNYCEENPNTCENDGKCTSLIKDEGYFRCECQSGYRGKKCEILPPSMMTTTTTTTTTVETETVHPLDVEDGQDDIDNEA